MSHKKSLGGTGGNTLFKYFAKSPATPNGGKSPAAASPSVIKKEMLQKSETLTPKPRQSSKKLHFGKRSSVDDNSPTLNSEDEDDTVNIPKRRRIALIDSDSESDRENAISNGDKPSTPSVKLLQSTPKMSKHGTPTSARKTPSANDSMTRSRLEEKLNETADESMVESVENREEFIDEPTVWMHNKLEFLKPDKIKDINGKRPSDPEYDNRTLYVPETFLSTLTPTMRQWWIIKSKHFDSVLFFKIGKFYELLHMDATVGATELGFSYMKGEYAHSGFPETAYDRMSTNLVERGFKVARIEQTETPEMVANRCKQQKMTPKHDKVVRREVCQITNKGTQVFGQQVAMTYKHQPNYLLAIAEQHNSGQTSRYGIVFIDTSIGDFYIGEFADDKHSSRLLTLLAHNPPVLVLHERNGLSTQTTQIMRTVLGNVVKEALTNKSQLWSAEQCLKVLTDKHYVNREEWPPVLKKMQSDDDHLGLTPAADFRLALKAFGGCLWYLTQMLLDQQIISMARYHMYLPPDDVNCSAKSLVNAAKESALQFNKHMVLDAITLANLRIIGEESSLLSTLDHCCTRFGKRLLHYWVCSPSCEPHEIRDRQTAIAELLQNGELLQECRALLATLPDLERHLAQIHTFGNAHKAKHHPDGRAVLFEERIYIKKKIQDFLATLNGFENIQQVRTMFSECASPLLKKLTQLEPIGEFPDMREVLMFFKKAFDHEEALKAGIIAPKSGVDAEYDATEDEIKTINKDLNTYLVSQEKYFGCRISFFGAEKKRFQLEVPENYAKKAGTAYQLEGTRKGSKPVKRFHTSETREFLRKMMQAEDQRKAVLKDLSRRIFEKFSANYKLWKRCVDLISTLDVLTSLAEYARNQRAICVPEIVDPCGEQVLEIENGIHPCMCETEDFIPNGIKLGDKQPALSLLTGPNMGGKSTLMRQIGLLAVMVQIGAHIPAESCRMSLIDRIFTRLGAQDNIMAGQSTFLVELSETSAILKHATRNSLVLLDELGRGTATYDGTAIAASVVHFLATLQCRALFSTHYHSLVDNFQSDSRIALGHMACMVENESTDDPTQETVTFLYKYSDGACPKSYGFNAAKLAGMPAAIIKRAYELSKKVEVSALKRRIFSKILNDNATVGEIRNLIEKLSF